MFRIVPVKDKKKITELISMFYLFGIRKNILKIIICSFVMTEMKISILKKTLQANEVH